MTCQDCVLFDEENWWCEGLMMSIGPRTKKCRYFVEKDQEATP